MEEVIRIFKDIQSASSLNEKKRIIFANRYNKLFKKCLKFLLDGNVVTGISTKKIHKKVEPSSGLAPYCLCSWSTFSDVIKYLEKNNTGRDKDIYEIQSFLSGNEQNREFYEQMITKTFRLGADAKLVNKCIPGLIPTFNVMLGTSIEKCKIKNGAWFSISQKLNGNRCVYYDGKFYTRQGKKYTGLEHIKRDLGKLITAKDYVFDGELIYKNNEALSDSDAFQKGTGIAQSKTDSKEELKLVLFDVLPKEEFDAGVSSRTYKQRREALIGLRAFETENLKIVKMFYEGTDQSQIWKWLDYAEEHDMEGVMINLDTPYECKRTKNLIKCKKFFSADLLCTGVEEGTGRNKGTLGSIVCDYKGYPLNVGSGFSDEDRELYWNHPDKIVGKIVSVKYKEETKNKDGGISIQFPVFEAVRFDKSEPDYPAS